MAKRYELGLVSTRITLKDSYISSTNITKVVL